jgi:hypothetical protein
MRASILIAALALPSSAIADSRCISLEAATLINRCETCTEVTVHALRPRGERAEGVFTGQTRTIRLIAGAREKLQDGEGWIISDLKACP